MTSGGVEVVIELLSTDPTDAFEHSILDSKIHGNSVNKAKALKLSGALIMGIRALLALLLVVLLLSTHYVQSSASTISYRCSTLYFFNGIVIYNSTISETLALETPRNISLAEGFEQRVFHILSYNLEYNETVNAFTFNVTVGGYFEGFFISRLEVCAVYTSRNLINVALEAPYSAELDLGGSIPEEVVKAYVRTPHDMVVSTVRPAYESWFMRTYLRDISSAKPAGIAITAGFFVQGVYIKYDAGTVPRTIEDVIRDRRGDCDDMSRVLVELLNAYEIPAVIQYGYVYIKNFNYTIPVENVTYVFINNGPHAFTTAYVPGFGWISLDFLAGSLILYPFVFEGYKRETEVDKEAVERFLDLHRAISAVQVMAILDESDVKQYIGYSVTLENALQFFNAVVKRATKQVTDNVSTVPEKTPTETPVTETPVTETPPEVTTERREETASTLEPTHEHQQPADKTDVTLIAVTLVVAITVMAVTIAVYILKKRLKIL